MPVTPFISFEAFNELDSDAKREFIQNNLTLKHVLTGPLGALYLQKLIVNANKWQPLSAKTKLAIMQYICSTDQFDVSGGFEQCFSRDFFGAFAMNDIIKDVFESAEDSVIGDLLYTLATNNCFTVAVPPRTELVEAQSKEILTSIVVKSFGKFDKDVTIIDAAANSLNANFIIMILELRQDFDVNPTNFVQNVAKAFNDMSVNSQYKPDECKNALKQIMAWLEKNNKYLTEEILIGRLKPLIETELCLEQASKSDEEHKSKKMKRRLSI